jgi:hypothetical protein
MRRALYRTTLVLACAAAAFMFRAQAMAAAEPSDRTEFGVRTGVYTEASAAFIGAEVLTPIAHAWYFDPNLEYAAAGGSDVLTVNGDFHYDFVFDRPYYVWAGAGPAVIVHDVEPGDRRSDLGANLIGGIGWKTSPKLTPYVQGKVTVSRDNEAVLAVGLRF